MTLGISGSPGSFRRDTSFFRFFFVTLYPKLYLKQIYNPNILGTDGKINLRFNCKGISKLF